jgi:tetratricopeptide (TPR) repeat protein
MMEHIIAENDAGLQKDDRFHVYSSIGYAYYQQKQYEKATIWLQKSLTLYPTNKFVQGILAAM